MSDTQIIPHQNGNGLLPITDALQAEQAYKAYLQLCQAVLIPYDKRIVDDRGVVTQESDYARIPQRRKDEQGHWITEYKDTPKKSAFRKLARFYGVSTEIIDKEKTVNSDTGVVTWHYTVRAWQGNVSTMGEAACSTDEGNRKRSEHDAKATAHTRAKNRAISDLIGFGQVSAEEITDTEAPQQKPRKAENAHKVKDTPKKKPKQEPQPETNPEPDTDEEAIIDTLAANGLGVHGFTIIKYNGSIRVTPPKDITPEKWDPYNEILTQARATWYSNYRYWEIPL